MFAVDARSAGSSGSFTHRRYPNGQYGSICLKCYLTAAVGWRDSLLAREEREHICRTVQDECLLTFTLSMLRERLRSAG